MSKVDYSRRRGADRIRQERRILSREGQAMRGKLPPSERDQFVADIAKRANGELVPLRDAVLALLTVADIERLARSTGAGEGELVGERNRARRRLLAALAEAPRS
jgi:hypothetical protein